MQVWTRAQVHMPSCNHREKRKKMWLLPKWIDFSFIHLNKLRIIIIHFYKSRISENDISSTITCYFIQYFISTVTF